MKRSPPPTVSMMILFSFFLGVVLCSKLEQNQKVIQLNRSLGDPRLNFVQRINRLNHLAQNKSAQLDFNTVIEQEIVAYEKAAAFLKQDSRYQTFEPGVQLIYNPEFNYGLLYWVQFNSTWLLSSEIFEEDNFVAIYSRQGEGHSSLSQIMSLPTGECYLFMVEASVLREDSVPSYWLYWETYTNENKPIGQSIISTNGSQPWSVYADTFCLSTETGNKFERVTVAPINLYGNATVHVGSARVYLLQPIEQMP